MLNNLYAIHGGDFRQLSTPTRPQAPSADRLADGTLILSLVGVLTRAGGTSTVGIINQLRQAAIDSSVSRIAIRVDSPGGESAGALALSDQVAATARNKPVVVYVENLCASAAFLAVCKSTKIVASRGALVGAIGTYSVVEDISGMAESMGIKVHVIKAGEFKGMGVAGTSLTDSQLREIQRVVNSINDQFLAAVATGRKLSGDKLKIVSDGRVWIASDALRYGLIDEIGTFESVLSSPITPASAGSNASRRQANPANDFYSRLAAQKESRGEAFVQTYRSSEK
jgi:protease-4